MNSLSVIQNRIPAMSESSIAAAQRMTDIVLKAPQTEIPTDHLFHAGTYVRTITIPAGVILCGALIKVATVLVVEGNCLVYVGDESRELNGYNVLAASAGRKQTFVAITDTHLTMIFATEATNVDKAEEEFTDEFELLFSRADGAVNNVTITGER